MKKLRKYYLNYLKIIFSIFITIIISNKSFSKDIEIEIEGNIFTDNNVILSLIKDKPVSISEEYSNYLIKTLNNSELFEDVSVTVTKEKYIILITEFANISNVYFKNNERLKDEELESIVNEMNINNLNPTKINNFIFELNKLYESFGYNNSKINYSTNLNQNTNTADIYFEIEEGEITKVNKIYFDGNENIENQILRSIIKTRTKTLRNIFANNNYKKFITENDLRLISNYYKNRGYVDVEVNYKIEFLKSNKVNIYFYINEGVKYNFSKIEYRVKDTVLNSDLENQIQNLIDKFIKENTNYSSNEIQNLKNDVSELIINKGQEFFEVALYEKKEQTTIDILIEILPIKPKYVKQINIYGNSRTYDNVIRRELQLIEGDALHKSQIENIRRKLISLNLFKSVEISERNIDNNLVDLDINIEEKQTGTVNAGLSIGTLDGFAVVAGLSERNFYGTGRSLNALINTSEDKTEFTFETTDRLLYENDVDISYKVNFKEEDFSKTSSYNLDTLTTGVGIGYKINKKLKHNVNIDYVIKDYTVTDASTVSDAIGDSSGENVSFLLRNNIFYSTLNPGFIPKNGQQLSFTNFIETPTSSSNGYIKNIITLKNFKKLSKNIVSVQARAGNIISLSNNDILTDDKFSLGGRWLRGFDAFGAGPRNSRTSYVGGNNIIVTKLDFSRELSDNSDFPIYFNVFNDYGVLWDNKTKPTNSDNSIRSSVGFGIKYYSPIGPIGFTWGFPVMDEDYDIKRMFLFSVGNID